MKIRSAKLKRPVECSTLSTSGEEYGGRNTAWPAIVSARRPYAKKPEAMRLNAFAFGLGRVAKGTEFPSAGDTFVSRRFLLSPKIGQPPLTRGRDRLGARARGRRVSTGHVAAAAAAVVKSFPATTTYPWEPSALMRGRARYTIDGYRRFRCRR